MHKTWVYRLYGDDILEEGITLVMSAAEYAARLQDIRTKLESEYTVTLPNRFPGPYIDIRLYPRSKTESGVEAMTTVFDRVTQSPEKLAENSFYVHVECNRDGEKDRTVTLRLMWGSTPCKGYGKQYYNTTWEQSK